MKPAKIFFSIFYLIQPKSERVKGLLDFKWGYRTQLSRYLAKH